MPYFPFSFENITFDWAAGELFAFLLVLGDGAQVERTGCCGKELWSSPSLCLGCW